MQLTLSIKGGTLADAAGALLGHYRPAAQAGMQVVLASVKRHTPVGVTEAARGSIRDEMRSDGPGLPIGTIGSPLKHVQVVNDGRRPGQKMPLVPGPAGPTGKTTFTVEPGLLLWVRRKIRIEEKARRRRRNESGELVAHMVKRRTTDDEAQSIGFLIARAIGKRGTKPVRMFEKAIEENQSKLAAIFSEVGMKLIVDLARGGKQP